MRFADRFVRLLCTAALLAGCTTPAPSARTPALPAAAAVQPVPKPAPEAPVSAEVQRDWDRALAHLKAGQDKEAEQVLLGLTRQAPGLSGSHANLGLLYQRAGRTAEAIAALEKAIEINPVRAVYYNELGVLYRQQGNFDAARKQYRKSLDVDPDFAPAHLNLAILYDLYLQEPKSALPHYQRYRALVPAEAATVSKWIVEIERRIHGGGRPRKGG